MATNVLEQPTLILNRNWQPIHVTTVVRALVMLWNDAARVVEPEEYRLYSWDEWARLEPIEGTPCIRSARARLRAPEVVCLSRFDRLPATAVTFSRRNVAKRDHLTCQYCGAQPGWEAITVDHVVPRSRGGVSTWTNCVAACVECNARKADRTPEQAGMRLKRRPARPRVEAALRRQVGTDQELGPLPRGRARPCPGLISARMVDGRFQRILPIDHRPLTNRSSNEGCPPGRGLRFQTGWTGFDSWRPCSPLDL